MTNLVPEPYLGIHAPTYIHTSIRLASIHDQGHANEDRPDRPPHITGNSPPVSRPPPIHQPTSYPWEQDWARTWPPLELYPSSTHPFFSLANLLLLPSLVAQLASRSYPSTAPSRALPASENSDSPRPSSHAARRETLKESLLAAAVTTHPSIDSVPLLPRRSAAQQQQQPRKRQRRRRPSLPAHIAIPLSPRSSKAPFVEGPFFGPNVVAVLQGFDRTLRAPRKNIQRPGLSQGTDARGSSRPLRRLASTRVESSRVESS